MATNYNKDTILHIGVSYNFNRENPTPLDLFSVFTSLADAKAYAENPEGVAYVGQLLVVVTTENNITTVDAYVIENTAGKLKKLADTKYVDSKVQDLSDALSSEVQNLSDALSIDLQNLSRTVSNSLTNIGNIITYINTDLDREISNIKAEIKGGVNYRGHINLDETIELDGYEGPQPKYPNNTLDLSALFGLYYGRINRSTLEYTENLGLSNGWLYNITTSAPFKFKDTDLVLENNDYLIIHNHVENSYGVDISSIVRDNVDYIESVQDDYVRLAVLSLISDTLSADAKSYADLLYTTTTTEDIPTLINAVVENVSAFLSDDYYKLIQQAKTDLTGYANSVSSWLSVALSNELVADYEEKIGIAKGETMQYANDVSAFLSDDYYKLIQQAKRNAIDSSTEILNTVINNVIVPYVDGISTELSTTCDIIFEEKLTAAKEYADSKVQDLSDSLSVTVSAELSDIRADVKGGVNYKGHISLLTYSSDLPLSTIFAIYYNVYDTSNNTYTTNKKLNNGWLYNITTLNAYAVGDTDPVLSLENNDYLIIHDHNLSSVDISAITRDNIDIIKAVLNDYVRLGLMEYFRQQIETDINTGITDIANDVLFLSSDLSNLEQEHYDKTFVKDHAIVAGNDISVDLLRLTDETNANNRYVMSLEDGTLVLKPQHLYELRIFNYIADDFDGSANVTRGTYNFGEAFGSDLPEYFKLNSLTIKAHIKGTITNYSDVFLAISENGNTTAAPKISRNCVSITNSDADGTLLTWNFDNLIIDKTKTYMLKFVDNQSSQALISVKLAKDISTATTWYKPNASVSNESAHSAHRLYVSSIAIYDV